MIPPKVSFDEIVARCHKVKPTRPWGEGTRAVKACCPAHDDQNPSLAIQELPDGTTDFKCWTGCTRDDIMKSLGWNWWDATPKDEAQSPLRSTPELQSYLMVSQARRMNRQQRSDVDRENERKALKILRKRNQMPSWYK